MGTEKEGEALACTLIFVLSIFFTVTTYSKVVSVNLFKGNEESIFTGDDENSDEIKVQHIINNWRAEYDHPCVVSKSRRKQTVTMDDVYKEYNDWSKFNRDSNVQRLVSPEKSPYPKDSSMAKP